MALTKSTTELIKDNLNSQLQIEAEKIKSKLLNDFTIRFKEEMSKIATELAINIDSYYNVQTFDNEVTVTLRVKEVE